MDIVKKLREEKTLERRMSSFWRSWLYTECKKTDRVNIHRLDCAEEYVLHGAYGITFWANKAQYSDARKQAERVLLQRMFGETLALLQEARKEVYAGDAAAVLAVLGQIESNLLKPREE